MNHGYDNAPARITPCRRIVVSVVDQIFLPLWQKGKTGEGRAEPIWSRA
jgi:hypothetical protein